MVPGATKSLFIRRFAQRFSGGDNRRIRINVVITMLTRRLAVPSHVQAPPISPAPKESNDDDFPKRHSLPLGNHVEAIQF